MCKILVIPHVPSSTDPKALWRFLKATRGPLVASDNHGFGFAAISARGQLAMAKWADVRAALAEVPSEPLFARYGDMLDDPSNADVMTLGPDVVGRKVRAVMLHARWATNGPRDVINAHPHTTDDGSVAIVHNGVLDTAKLDLRNTDCDSEGIAWGYVESGAHKDPRAVRDLVSTWRGYFGIGALVKVGRSTWHCDVLRDSGAQLSACAIKELGLVAFCTAPDVVAKACKAAGFKRPTIAPVRAYKHVRIDVQTGALVHEQSLPFVPGISRSVPAGVGLNTYLSAERDEAEQSLSVLNFGGES